MRCENCGCGNGPFHTMHWQSVGEVELYCQECFDREMGTVGGVMQADPDEPLMTDAELNAILQL
jgi:hypothetical protein